MTMKGFDITKMDARKLQLMEVFKTQIRTQLAQRVGLLPSQLTVTFKAGSIIVIAAVAEGAMPANPDLGDGEDILQVLTSTPEAAVLVEDGKTLADCFVDPEPAFPVQDVAAAVGDPHLTTIFGAKIDLKKIDLH